MTEDSRDTGSSDRNGKHREQSDYELTPKDTEPSENQSPDEMDIDPSRLFEQAVEQTRMALCVTDPHRPDNPIVYLNQAFVELTGYSREETLGRNCSFLQGPDTDPAAVARIRRALGNREVRVIELLNYRKDGSTFWNSLHVGPIFDDDGRLTHFYGSQWDVSEVLERRAKETMQRYVAEELQHRTRNIFGVLNALLRLSAREAEDKADLVEILSGRLDAMNKAHSASIAPGGDTQHPGDLHTLAETILRPYRTDAKGRIGIDGPAVRISPQNMTPLGLVMHELATNALKYGALNHPDGRIEISWAVEDETLQVDWSESGHSPRQDGAAGAIASSGTGSRLMKQVVESADGTFDMQDHGNGMRARIRLAL